MSSFLYDLCIDDILEANPPPKVCRCLALSKSCLSQTVSYSPPRTKRAHWPVAAPQVQASPFARPQPLPALSEHLQCPPNLYMRL